MDIERLLLRLKEVVGDLRGSLWRRPPEHAALRSGVDAQHGKALEDWLTAERQIDDEIDRARENVE